MFRNDPKISVLMSVYNGEKYLKEAVDSILNQTFSDFEFIIIDDGSFDNSADIIKKNSDPRILLLQQKNLGLAGALNKGIWKARGKYIARMDADDVSLPERLQTQYDFFESHPECVLLGSNYNAIDLEGNYLYTSNFLTNWKDIKETIPNIPIAHPAAMYRTDIAIRCEGYYERIRHFFEDAILWNKMAHYGEIYNIHKPLIKYRFVFSSITNLSLESKQTIKSLIRSISDGGEITEKELAKLKNITKRRSNSWKWSNYYLTIGKIYLEIQRDKKRALSKFLLSIKNNPANTKAWFNAMLTLLPFTVINYWKGIRCGRENSTLS